MSNATDKKSEPTISEGPISTRAELKQVEERVAIGANVVYETIRREREEELHRTVSALAWSALAAGLSMGFSFITEALLITFTRQTLAYFHRSIRLQHRILIVVLGRQQLFTENTLTVVLPLLLLVVLVGNLVGTFLLALCLARFISSTFPHSKLSLKLALLIWVQAWAQSSCVRFLPDG